MSGRACLALAFATLAVPLGALTAKAQDVDGTYVGSLSCERPAAAGNSWSYEASHNGTIAMRGVQKWHVNRGNQDRQCVINARRR